VARCKFRDTDGVTRRVERRGPLDEFDKHGKLAEVQRIDDSSRDCERGQRNGQQWPLNSRIA